jgi:hypothetical protein
MISISMVRYHKPKPITAKETKDDKGHPAQNLRVTSCPSWFML